MTAFHQIVKKSYRLVIRKSPEEAAMDRRRLEAAQIIDRPITMLSRHNFQPPLSFSLHQKHDPILQAAYSILYDFSYSTFAAYLNPLEIEPLFTDDAVFLHQALLYGTPASAMYAIGRFGFIAKVRLFMMPWSGQIFVQDQEEFVELTEWLKTLPPPYGSKTGEQGYEFLQGWWKATGGMVRLMDLPPELWTYVFELAFGFDIYPSSTTSLGSGSKHPKYYRNVKYAPPPTRGVLTLNKAIFEAVTPFVLKRTCKCFQDAYYLRNTLRLTASPLSKAQNLQVLELDLENVDYFALFGVRVAPFTDHPEILHAFDNLVSLASYIRDHLPITHLFLRFNAPTDGKADPWYNTGKLNGHGEDMISDFQGRTRHWAIGCQKVVVDWILTFAKEYIEKIPKVTLYGNIKNSTKAKWDKILKDERESTGAEIHDMTDEKSIIEHWDTNDL